VIFFWRKTPEKFLAKHSPETVHWLACTVSTIQYLDMLPNVQLEAKSPTETLKTCWGRKGKEGRWDVWVGPEHKAGSQLVVSEKSFAPFFLYAHLSFKTILESLQKNALQSAGGVTTPELTQEGKSLQWLQATMKVLISAVESCQKDSTKLLQASFFIGEKEKGAPPIFRALVFSLDITAAFDADGALGIVIFDDKNKGTGTAQTPALEARFRALKPPVLDEFIRLAHTVMQTCEMRYK
jgi:hypothetical protein